MRRAIRYIKNVYGAAYFFAWIILYIITFIAILLLTRRHLTCDMMATSTSSYHKMFPNGHWWGTIWYCPGFLFNGHRRSSKDLPSGVRSWDLIISLKSLRKYQETNRSVIWLNIFIWRRQYVARSVLRVASSSVISAAYLSLYFASLWYRLYNMIANGRCLYWNHWIC